MLVNTDIHVYTYARCYVERESIFQSIFARVDFIAPVQRNVFCQVSQNFSVFTQTGFLLFRDAIVSWIYLLEKHS